MADDDPYLERALVMPFMAITSKGGPFDDQAYTAGYEMGLLDATLGSLYTFGLVYRTLRVENREQADLLAMRHGWTSTFYEHGDGWVGAEFKRAAAVPDPTEEGPRG